MTMRLMFLLSALLVLSCFNDAHAQLQISEAL